MHAAPERRIPTRRLHALALLVAVVLLGACAGGGGAPSGPFPGLAQFAGREIRRVKFEGDLEIAEDTLRRVVTTRGRSCRLLFIPICPFGYGRNEPTLDLGILSRDVVRIQLAYRDNGYYGTRVVPDVQEIAGGDVDVTFRITPGDLVTLRVLALEGVERADSTGEIARKLPLKVNEPFRRNDFLASVDTVRNNLLDRGFPYAQVLRNYSIDTIADVAEVQLVANTGPLVTVDTILFAGLDRISERTARHQIAIREGRRLRATDLSRSQRNLFELELVDFAAVEVAPDSLQLTPDSAELEMDSIGSTVIVRVAEAARYAVDLSAGYGTQDCLRARGSHTDRNFLGGARRLEVSGLVSKLGAAGPVEGLRDTPLCDEFQLDSTSTPIDTTIASALNYRVAADFVQPRLFGIRTSFLASAYAERLTEVGLYLRSARGGQAGFVRQVATGTLLSGTFTVERSRTEANDFFFCVAVEVCNREDIEALKRSRWSNSLNASVLRNRVRLDPFPSGGHQLRTTIDYASAVLGSQDEYLRVYADGTVYRRLGGAVIASGRLAGGTFFQGVLSGDGYIPPNRRFYGGGPAGVRGFPRNELGPQVYVQRTSLRDRDDVTELDVDTLNSATGGTRTLLGTLEVTAPSPFLRESLRLAGFVDAGRVWDPATRQANGCESRDPGLRITPGIGLRYATPVGPLRVDVAYNPYDPERGCLYAIDENDRLLPTPINQSFAPEGRGGALSLNRFIFQLSVGQTF
ncbi:MAG TPA: BamA/TamA family outer membrane protein [Longimicrobium sp.]|nr:BamA/TamA family outer membrane protein [Longimicrobium sp.]